MTSPTMSVVVMGYRNQATIVQSLTSVLTQVTSEPFETVVVSSGGDGTGDLVRSHFPDLRMHESATRLLPGAARNVGTRMARGDFVAFLAADCLAEPGWVESRVAAHRSGHEAVASAMAIPSRAPAVEVAGHFLLNPNRSPDCPAGPATQGRAYGLSYSRELLDRLGPFDETLRVGEDTVVADRLNELGVTAWFEPSVRTLHMRNPRTVSELMRDQHRRGRWYGQWTTRGQRLPIGDQHRRFQEMTWFGARWLVVTAKSLLWWRRRLRLVLNDARNSLDLSGTFRAAVHLWIVTGSVAYQAGCGAEWLKNWNTGS